MIKIFHKQSILFFFMLSIVTAEYSIERKIGDVLQLGLPATAILSTYYMEDSDGFKSFIKSYAITVSATSILKVISHKERPDGSDYMSFPSGHTSSAFSGSSFIHFRYGLRYAAPLYLLAAFTGYSRIESNKHYLEDVIAGASLAIFSSWCFTKKYDKKYSFQLDYDRNNKMIILDFNKSF